MDRNESVRRDLKMQFSRIRLENWRNFGDVDVPVATRVFLVGANASGKSNFLDALRFLRMNSSFPAEILRRRSVIVVAFLPSGAWPRDKNSNIAIEVDIGTDECRLWRYRIVFNQEDRSPS